MERGEESEEGGKVTRSARERGSGTAEPHWGPSLTGTAWHSKAAQEESDITREVRGSIVTSSWKDSPVIM